MIDINYCSQKGLCDTNQDFILRKQLQDGSCIAILADGMGGLQYGEIAAATVAQSIYKILAEHNSVDIRELLAKAFEQADIAVADKCKTLCCKMGAAVTVLYIKDDTAYYAWQGNVRLYYKKGKGIHQLTEDHQKEGDNCTFLTRCVNGRGFRQPYIHSRNENIRHGLVVFMYRWILSIQGLHRFCYSRKQIAKSYRILGR